MSVHDAQPGDVYIDETGKLWRCEWCCAEPSVCLVEVEPSGYIPPPDNAVDIATGQPAEGSFLRTRKSGGVNGYMWHGFKRIWQKE